MTVRVSPVNWLPHGGCRNLLCGLSAVAGILGQELLGRTPEWYNVGATEQFMPQSALLAIEFFVLGHFEVKRYQGWNKHKTVSNPSAPPG